jgi:glyoxylase-like metal-dependent hydrolase (beta-lactamase superfamily II)
VPSPTPISAVQADAVARRSLPPVELIRDGIWSLSIPFAGPVDDYTLTYAIEGSDGSIALIDPGWETDENVRLLDEQLRSVGHSLDHVTFAAVTHLHVDHVSAANSVRRASEALVGMHPVEQAAIVDRPDAIGRDDAKFVTWGVPVELIPGLSAEWSHRTFPHVEADVLLEDGELLPIPGRDIRAIWTPGHTSGHLCFSDAAAGLLFTGDHVLPRIHPGIGLGGESVSNPLHDFLESLDRVAADFPDVEVCPGHEFRFAGLRDRCEEMIAHRRTRTEGVAAALDRLDRPTLWQVAAEQRWSGGWEALAGYRLASALAQTSFHVDEIGRSAELSVL